MLKLSADKVFTTPELSETQESLLADIQEKTRSVQTNPVEAEPEVTESMRQSNIARIFLLMHICGMPKPQKGSPKLPDVDPYAPRLGKGAEIWKIYVEEADKWDKELSEGWNKLSYPLPGSSRFLTLVP